MNTETKLKEAMKVVEAARNFSAAIDGRVVRQTQDKLYKSVKVFDKFAASLDCPDCKYNRMQQIYPGPCTGCGAEGEKSNFEF